MPKNRPLRTLAVLAVFAAAFTIGFVLMPAPAAAQCDLLVAGCPGIGCFSWTFECNCLNQGGQPRLEQIYFCDEDPSIIIGRQCTNQKC